MELGDGEESPAHNTATVVGMVAVTGNYYDELKDIFEQDLIYFFGEALHNSSVSPMASVSPASPVSPVAPVSPVCPEFPPSLPLPSPQSASSSAPVQLLSASPSAALIRNVLPSVCRPAASSSPMDPLAPPSSSVPPAQPLPSGFPVRPRTFVTVAPPQSPVPSVSLGHIDSSAPSGCPSVVAASPLAVSRVSTTVKA